MPARSRPARTAILVIHGIGEQNPYETLDSFARGLVQYFASSWAGAKVSLEPERINHGDWTEAAVHVDAVNPADLRDALHLSLFEFYWAPYTEGKVTYRGVLSWLARSALTPLRYWSDNLATLLAARAEPRKEGKPAAAVAWLFIREVLRAVGVYVPVLGLVALIAWLITQVAPQVRQLGTTLAPTLAPALAQHPWPLAGCAASLILALTLAWFIVQEVVGWLRRTSPSIEPRADLLWFVSAMPLCAVFVVATIALAAASELPLQGAALLKLLMGVVPALAVVWSAWLLRRILVGYLGDIAVYVTADAKAASYAARTAILDQSTTALARLLCDDRRGFDQVIVAGHSLGSVIAYDTINELLSRVWAARDQLGRGVEPLVQRDDLTRLRGLVTFGSPLDKIYYLFREHVGSDQAVRAQILSFLHSYRRGRSGRDYGSFKFTYPPDPKPGASPKRGEEPLAFPQLDSPFKWLNVWSPMDPVSGPLHFYEVDERRMRWYVPWWGVAHMRYWSDKAFYAAIAEAFLV